MAEVSEPRIYETGVVACRALLPEGPKLWSYSSLKEVETCPRRYALSRADYPDLWTEHGYPRLPIPAVIRGDVVHSALELIVKALVKAGCESTRSAAAVEVLRALGGYTKAVEGVLARELARYEGNPRLSDDRREQIIRTLDNWVPEAREQIQTYLSRIELRRSSARSPVGSGVVSDNRLRRRATAGDHPERELIAESLRLKGRIDLLSVDATAAYITDFKTGAETQAHHDQLRFYALLWQADDVVNPDGLPIGALVAAYPGHDVRVTVPSAEEVADLRTSILSRIEAADSAVTGEPPPAMLGDHCRLCSVRGLCNSYWTAGVPPIADLADGQWCDIAGTVVRQHGVKSFVLREEETGHEVIVRTPTPFHAAAVGSGIRLLGVRRVVDLDEEDALIVALTSVSEILELSV